MIRTEKLSKSFQGNKREIKAVDGLDLQVDEGEVFGFLGPNGAGKTTTVRMLACLIAPSGGSATVNGLKVGRDDDRIRGQIGFLTESPGLYERLSALYNLRIFAELYSVTDVSGQVEKYLRLLDLWERRDEPAGTFSKGMKQKLSIARALLHEPPVLFLDEPTSALDPEAAKTVRDFIASLKGQGRTVFLCTHNLAEAEQLCDRIAVFKQKLIAVDTPENLRHRLFGTQVVVQLTGAWEPFCDVVRRMPFVKHVALEAVDGSGGRLVITLQDPEHNNPELVSTLVGQGARIQYVTELRHSLEEVYLNLVHADAGARGGQS